MTGHALSAKGHSSPARATSGTAQLSAGDELPTSEWRIGQSRRAQNAGRSFVRSVDRRRKSTARPVVLVERLGNDERNRNQLRSARPAARSSAAGGDRRTGSVRNSASTQPGETRQQHGRAADSCDPTATLTCGWMVSTCASIGWSWRRPLAARSPHPRRCITRTASVTTTGQKIWRYGRGGIRRASGCTALIAGRSTWVTNLRIVS